MSETAHRSSIVYCDDFRVSITYYLENLTNAQEAITDYGNKFYKKMVFVTVFQKFTMLPKWS
jgi:hypothetical protein